MEMKRKWKMKHKRGVVLALAASLTLFLAGCRGNNQDEADNISSGADEYIYTAEYQSLGVDYVNNITYAQNALYYVHSSWDEAAETSHYTIYEKDLNSMEEARAVPVDMPPERSIMCFIPAKDGTFTIFAMEYQESAGSPGNYTYTYYISKYDSQGSLLTDQDISSILSESEYSYINSAALDTEGRIYARSEQDILLFQSDGTYYGSVSVSNYIMSLGNSKDGGVYVNYHGNEGSIVVSEVDFTSKSLGEAHSSFPGYNQIYPGLEKDILTYNESKVYEYDLSTDTYTEVLSWMDSNINGQYVQNIAVVDDGRIAAFYREWSSDTDSMELILLTKTDASSIPAKEVILIGTLSSSQLLQDLAVKFNKSNDTLQIKIKEYLDQNNWTETSYQDAITALNNDITSGSGPDIIVLSDSLPISSYAEKGLLEDLAVYLEKSASLNQSDFIESVLNAYTYDEKLIAVAESFSLQTILGKTSLVGEKAGWTLDEMMDFAASHPEAELFSSSIKQYILSDSLQYNQNAFIDYTTGKCHFDTEDFKKVLEYANLFPTEYNYDENDKSTPWKIQNNAQLLEKIYISYTQNFQMYLYLFEEPVTCIGYPTVDGSSGTILYSSSAYGISSLSKHKESAWTFIEYLLNNAYSSNMFFYGFPSIKSQLEEVFEKDMTEDYMLDENGEPYLDENGDPQINPKTTWGWEEWETTIYAATSEEIDMLWDIINSAQPAVYYDQQILTIILEEAEPYFQGQKSVDDVAQVIQSRIQIYISENS